MGALDGIRVVDLTVWLLGPIAAQHLADFGAEVIHVERPAGGDPGRGVASIRALPVGDWNQYFLVINRNKKSLAADLRTAGGREIVHRLVADSDVFLSNLLLEQLTEWELSYDVLREINPRLVYARTTGYGPRTEVSRPTFDMTVQGLTGLMSRLGEPGQPPAYLGMGSGDTYGGLMAALGILLALHERDRTGRGQYVDASLYGAQLFLAAPSLQPYLATGDERYEQQRSRRDAPNALWNTYEASDGWLVLCVADDDATWERFSATLGGRPPAGDPRFASAADRARHARDLVAALDDAIRERTADHWLARWRDAGLPAEAVGTFADLAIDPQAWANDYLVEAWCEPVRRTVPVRGLPIGLDRTPGAVRTLGPELGEHTELILTDMLGYTWDDVTRFQQEGAIP
jgi:crotonobetainyl-CoA:carnitine CoA-transferase CaiB-like acyl-CoA transferase